MYVGLVMNKQMPVITADTLVTKADRMMEEHRLWLLLVVHNGILQGYVSREDVRAALPSEAVTFSKHELNYLLSKLTVKKMVRSSMPTVRPETEIETAALLMQENNLAGLAVVDGSGKLVGYISRSSMLDVLVDEMGLAFGGQRIALEVEDRRGVLVELSKLFFEHGANILSMSTFLWKERRILVFRISEDDNTLILAELEKRGYCVAGPEYFAREWGK